MLRLRDFRGEAISVEADTLTCLALLQPLLQHFVGLAEGEQVFLPLYLLLHVFHVALGDQASAAEVTAFEQVFEHHLHSAGQSG